MNLRPSRSRAGHVLIWLAAWGLLGLLLTAQEVALSAPAFHWPGFFRVLESRLMQAYVTGLTAAIAWYGGRAIRSSRLAGVAKALLHGGLFAAFGIASVLAASGVRYLADPKLREAYAFGEILEITFLRSVSFVGLLYGLIVLAESLVNTARAAHQRALENAELRGRLSEARLEMLRLQLQPHFLFNTLHAAASLVDSKPQTARRMLSDLGELLRASLDGGDEPEVSLRVELSLLERYLEIQRARFGDRLRFDISVQDSCLALPVPSMLFQPLVENSIRHGLADRPGPGSVRVTCERLADTLRIVVSDDGRGLPEGALREGVGLGNTRARIEALYGEAGAFDLEARPDGGTAVVIQIPVRKSTAGGGTLPNGHAS